MKKEVYASALKSLLNHFPDGEAQAILRILKFDCQEEYCFKQAVERVLSGVPVQQVVGKTEFFKCIIKVNENVLIPRPETEELVEWVVKENVSKKNLNVLDIGTGSGCIPIALSCSFPDWEVSACEVSPQALALAKENAVLNKAKVQFLELDVLQATFSSYPGKQNIIISNPPYVLKSEAAAMTAQVLEHEPHLALFVPDEDPLVFYRKIAELGKDLLLSEGQVYLECNEKNCKEVADLFLQEGYKEVSMRKDLSKKDRFVHAVKAE